MNKPQQSPVILAFIAGTGMFLSTLDSGIINIAIPNLLSVFKTSLSTVIWTVTLYTLLLSATVLLFGKLADRFGRVRIYVWGLWLFAISSLLCGAATNVWLLIIFRGLQGLSAAMLQATSMALITTRSEGDNLNKAMGIFGVLLGLGAMLGPVIGGIVLSITSWRWIFWINIPICLLGIYGCRKLCPIVEDLQPKPIHYMNLMLIGISIFLLLLTMNIISDGTNLHYFTAVGLLLALAIYFVFETRAEHPIIPLHLFKQLCFTAPMLGVFAFGGATAVAFILPPLFLENLRGMTPLHVGTICLSSSLGIVIIAQIASRLVKKMGTLIPMISGLSIMTVTLLMLAQMQVSWSVPWIFTLLLGYGIGGGLLQTPCYTNITSQFEQSKQAFIASLIRMVQNLSIAVLAAGAALFISIKPHDSGDHLLLGIQHAWYMAAAVCIIALVALIASHLQARNRPIRPLVL